MTEIVVRKLQVDDVFCVAKMLGQVTKGARVELASALAGEKVNPTEIGMVLFQSLVTEAAEDLKQWLASLIGKEVAEFEAMPPTILLDIIEKLVEQEDAKDFFARASSLVGKLTG